MRWLWGPMAENILTSAEMSCHYYSRQQALQGHYRLFLCKRLAKSDNGGMVWL